MKQVPGSTAAGLAAAGPLIIDLPLAVPPSRIQMEPGSRPVEFLFEAGMLQCRVDHCGTHEMMVVDLSDE